MNVTRFAQYAILVGNDLALIQPPEDTPSQIPGVVLSARLLTRRQCIEVSGRVALGAERCDARGDQCR